MCSRPRSYAHIGTGNYHVRTAILYTDVGIFTCNPDMARDVVHFIHYLTGRSEPLFTAHFWLRQSLTMRPRFLEMIRREIANHQHGRPARIAAKIKQPEDPELIGALVAAATAGVSVDLTIRGFCCRGPGVPGRTEGIRVRSIIGRF